MFEHIFGFIAVRQKKIEFISKSQKLRRSIANVLQQPSIDNSEISNIDSFLNGNHTSHIPDNNENFEENGSNITQKLTPLLQNPELRNFSIPTEQNFSNLMTKNTYQKLISTFNSKKSNEKIFKSHSRNDNFISVFKDLIDAVSKKFPVTKRSILHRARNEKKFSSVFSLMSSKYPIKIVEEKIVNKVRRLGNSKYYHNRKKHRCSDSVNSFSRRNID